MMEFLLNSKQRIIAIGDDFGLTSMQTIMLMQTNNEEPRSMSSFCKMFHCDASNITGIVDGLEQKKLVSRQEHPSDRRVKIIKLEPAGKDLREKMLGELNNSSNSLLSALSPTEAEQFVVIIEKLTDNRSA